MGEAGRLRRNARSTCITPRGALATATPAAAGLAAVHALESRPRLTRPKRKPTAERPGGGRRVGRLMAPSIAIDIHPEGTAARVDVVNTFRCIRRSFHVVSRCQIRSFRSSQGLLRRVRFPAAPLRKCWSEPQALASFLLRQAVADYLHAEPDGRSATESGAAAV
jgi:hypothetical protein